MKAPSLLLALLVVAACAPRQGIPPEPAPPAAATFVSARFDLTWNAAIDLLADAGVPIATRDRDAGRIETERVTVDPSEGITFADCGSAAGGSREPAASVVYAIVVTDDGNSSSILVTASWVTADPRAPFRCETTRVWEADAQQSVKLVAEANR